MDKYVLTLILVLFCGGNSLYAGKLDKARKEVRGEDDEDKEKKNNNNGRGRGNGNGGGRGSGRGNSRGNSGWGNTSSNNSDRYSGVGGVFQAMDDMAQAADAAAHFFRVTGIIVSSPFMLPHQAWDDTDIAEFSSYPYQRDYPGFMKGQGKPGKQPDSSFRLLLEGGYDYEGVTSFSGNFLLETESRFAIELGSTYMREWIDDSTYDSLSMSEFNFLFRFVQNPTLQMRAGLGLRFMNDYIGSENGLNFTYGFDVYPQKPWVISASIDLGSLGEASVFATRFTLGALWGRFEFYAGYNSLKIGEVKIHGPVGGIRYWW